MLRKEATEVAERKITYREAIAEAIKEEMARDERVFLMGEDLGKFGGAFGTTRGLYQEFGEERVKDTPISETAIVGFGVGAALVGMRPIVEIMRIDWSTIAMDEIVNHAAKMRYLSGGKPELAMVIKTNAEGGLGLGAQHSQSFEAWFVHVPGLKVVMPSDPYDGKGILKAAIRDPNPVVFIEPTTLLSLSGAVPDEDYVVPLGKAAIKREGKDVTVVAWGTLLPKALNAAQTLAGEGIEVEVIDPRTLRPLDIDTIVDSVKKTGRLVVAHQAIKTCGVGAEIVAQVQEIAFDHLDAPIKRVATPDVIIPVNRNLERVVFPQEEEIIAAVKSIL
ncbi:MAG TPA: alpha-ketoacid dehydrogenase subunit beta [Dehalococcoidia bacterium]|jgi:pyruvate/2-oxoglutarate/acetoin dehydrogenase E1 component|nr:alpha-ketoacid dehydrogenase subunit beta [Dehalococcoidia bacterium]